MKYIGLIPVWNYKSKFGLVFYFQPKFFSWFKFPHYHFYDYWYYWGGGRFLFFFSSSYFLSGVLGLYISFCRIRFISIILLICWANSQVEWLHTYLNLHIYSCFGLYEVFLMYAYRQKKKRNARKTRFENFLKNFVLPLALQCAKIKPCESLVIKCLLYFSEPKI